VRKKECNKTKCAIQKHPETTTTMNGAHYAQTHTFACQTVKAIVEGGKRGENGENWVPYNM